MALADRQGALLNRVSYATQAERGREVLLRRIVDAVRHMAAPLGLDEVMGVGVAAPGPIDPFTGVIYNPPNLPGWEEVPLKSILEAELGTPVFVGNDANLAALGEHEFGAGRGLNHMVYLTVSTGIGGGIIVDGRLLLGARGLAGEAGHMTIDPDGPPCGCGNVGCLEVLASGTAIGRIARERLARGEHSTMLEHAGGRLEAVTAETVEAAALAGDAVAKAVMKTAASYLGIGVSNLVNLFNPEAVVLGGGVARAGELLFEPVRREVEHRVMPKLREGLRIVPASLGDDVGLLGAVALVLEGRGLRRRE